MRQHRRALLSVSSREGVVDLAQRLLAQGFSLIAADETLDFLREASIEVTALPDFVAHSPQLQDRALWPVGGPGLEAQLLAQTVSVEGRVEPLIELVVVNLPQPIGQRAPLSHSAQGAEEALELPKAHLLRTAVRWRARTSTLVSPHSYAYYLDTLAEERGRGAEEVQGQKHRDYLAALALEHVAAYDWAVGLALSSEALLAPEHFLIHAVRVRGLRYGENPLDIGACLYGLSTPDEAGDLRHVRLLQGREISYNNLLDADIALRLALAVGQQAAVIVKCAIPCGLAVGPAQMPGAQLLQRALESDPHRAGGGLVLCSAPVDRALAQVLLQEGLRFDAVLAPDFTPEACALLAQPQAQSLSLLRLDPWPVYVAPAVQLRTVLGGFLYQMRYPVLPLFGPHGVGEVMTHKGLLTEALREALILAWKTVHHVRSIATVIVQDQQLIGMGSGQVSRRDSCLQAIEKAQAAGHSLRGSVMASDGHFAQLEILDLAIEQGVAAVIVSRRWDRVDQQLIQRAKEAGIVLVMSWQRQLSLN